MNEWMSCHKVPPGCQMISALDGNFGLFKSPSKRLLFKTQMSHFNARWGHQREFLKSSDSGKCHMDNGLLFILFKRLTLLLWRHFYNFCVLLKIILAAVFFLHSLPFLSNMFSHVKYLVSQLLMWISYSLMRTLLQLHSRVLSALICSL